MHAERWHQIDQLFHLALEHEPSERSVFLAQACSGDESLRSEVESLVSFHEQGESFIEKPASDLAAELLANGQAGVEVGQSVGPYKIVSVLGMGGMGEVYLAEDMRLGRQVALKLLPGQFTINAERVRRFELEARAASALNHPNIVTIHEIGKRNGTQFIVTEFVDGRTLRQRITETGISLSETLDIAIQIASALEAAHAARIVHRDIKPENIMLRADGYVKVLDFGLAKLTERPALAVDIEASTRTPVKTDPGMVMGTVQYMSPEQSRGREVDERTDIWSLGALLYEIVTGHVPFEGETPSHIVVSILEKDPPPFASYTLEVPAELEQIVKRALAKDRAERYQTANDLLTDLKNLKQDFELRAKLNEAWPVDPRVVASRASDLQPPVETDERLTTRTGKTGTARAASSAEYLIAEIKKHKRVGALGLVALAIVLIGLVFVWTTNRPKRLAPGASLKTIAVLPFKPLVANSRNESLELGMADTLINKLSSIREINVRPISAVRKYSALDQDALAAGRELGVDAVLDGSIQWDGENKIRVVARLLNVKDGSTIWTDKCDEQCDSIFSVQDSIAGQLSRALALTLSGQESKLVARHYTENPDAYSAYVKGQYFFSRWRDEGFEKSIGFFQQAVDKDPNYALAYAGLAEAYGLQAVRGSLPADEVWPKAKVLALKALEIDPTLAQAHNAVGEVNLYYDWNWPAAEKEFKTAIELNPSYAMPHRNYAACLQMSGRFDEAIAERKRAIEIDPRDIITNNEASQTFFLAGQYEQAIKQAKMVMEMNQNLADGHASLANAYLLEGKYDEAIAEFQKSKDLAELQKGYPGHRVAAHLGYAYAVSGRTGEALKVLDEMKRQSKQRYVSPLGFAIIFTGLGDKDQAFAWLQKACKDRSNQVRLVKVDPMFESLRTDPRYPELLRCIGLAP